eukprot:gene6330-6138_t
MAGQAEWTKSFAALVADPAALDLPKYQSPRPHPPPGPAPCPGQALLRVLGRPCAAS